MWESTPSFFGVWLLRFAVAFCLASAARYCLRFWIDQSRLSWAMLWSGSSLPCSASPSIPRPPSLVTSAPKTLPAITPTPLARLQRLAALEPVVLSDLTPSAIARLRST